MRYRMRLEVNPGLESVNFTAGEGLSIRIVPFDVITSAR